MKNVTQSATRRLLIASALKVPASVTKDIMAFSTWLHKLPERQKDTLLPKELPPHSVPYSDKDMVRSMQLDLSASSHRYLRDQASGWTAMSKKLPKIELPSDLSALKSLGKSMLSYAGLLRKAADASEVVANKFISIANKCLTAVDLAKYVKLGGRTKFSAYEDTLIGDVIGQADIRIRIRLGREIDNRGYHIPSSPRGVRATVFSKNKRGAPIGVAFCDFDSPNIPQFKADLLELLTSAGQASKKAGAALAELKKLDRKLTAGELSMFAALFLAEDSGQGDYTFTNSVINLAITGQREQKFDLNKVDAQAVGNRVLEIMEQLYEGEADAGAEFRGWKQDLKSNTLLSLVKSWKSLLPLCLWLAKQKQG